MPPSSAPVTEGALNHPHVTATAVVNPGQDTAPKHVGFSQATFIEPNFEAPAAEVKDGAKVFGEDLSPTQTRQGGV